jgi:hypothetical protein
MPAVHAAINLRAREERKNDHETKGPVRGCRCCRRHRGTIGKGARELPDKLIKMIVPAPAGGQTDVLARLLAQKIQQAVGQNVIIDNRPGAGGALGAGLWRLPSPTATPCSTAIPRPWR